MIEDDYASTGTPIPDQPSPTPETNSGYSTIVLQEYFQDIPQALVPKKIVSGKFFFQTHEKTVFREDKPNGSPKLLRFVQTDPIWGKLVYYKSIKQEL
jgi:hypothetical protein